MDDLHYAITATALGLGVVSFILFVVHMERAAALARAERTAITRQVAEPTASLSVTLPQVTDLLKAFAALGIGGPALAFLLASVFHMAIAAAGVGVFADKPSAAVEKPKSAAAPMETK